MEHRNSVLIVEDYLNINGLLKEALEKEGLNPNRYKIRCAAQSEILQGGFEDEEIINYRTNLSVAHLE